MRILAAHVGGLHAKTQEAIDEYAPFAEITDVSESNFSYWNAIAERWNSSDDLMTIEQDIEILPECVSSFENCPEPWCVYAYHGAGVFGRILDESLGCTRFRKELMADVPSAAIAQNNVSHWPGVVITNPEAPGVVWSRVDYRISHYLKHKGYQVHVHGEVKHYHAYPDATVNAIVESAISTFMKICSFNDEEKVQKLYLDYVGGAIEIARSGEINARHVLLSQPGTKS